MLRRKNVRRLRVLESRRAENRRQAAERARDVRAHKAVGFEIQQRRGAGEDQSNARKQGNRFRFAAAGMEKKRRKAPEEQHDRHAHPGRHPAQPELGEDEAGAEPEHRPKSQKYCCRDGHCFARLSRLTTEDGRCYDTAQCGSHKV